MDHSIRANILTTTRYLPFFTTDSLNKFKSCLLEQFGCKNEADFLQKALNCMHSLLTHESSETIKNTSIEIAESQCINTNNNNVTVYKYVQQQQLQSTDIFSRLHSNIIDHFGSFLTKQESIIFGYLNRHTFIESQKKCFLLQRCKDERLTITVYQQILD